MDNLKYAVEGILFAAGEPVKTAQLAAALDTDIKSVNEAVRELKDEYNTSKRGFAIIDINEGYQICSRPEYYAYIQVILGEQRRQALSNAAMETLAIIAYKQPITKSGIEYIRGINSDGSVNRLIERGLVEERGRLNAPGRPILYGTTVDFLRCFGLSTLSELPEVNLETISNGVEDVKAEDILPEGSEGT
ncbi:MAG: SMC-Scp complex subunit ScpB [Clostridia bacterium]|nr:SMC-Scp complex subunit ScpB [Clostridia bacterium]